MSSVPTRGPAEAGSPRPRWTPRSIAVWTAVALVGAVAWGMIAIGRGEEVSAAWLVFAALASYAIGYRFYARFIQYKVLITDDTRATPAERLDNGADYHPTDRRVLFGHHFAAIAGAGPLVGPVLAAQMGFLPGTIWIIVGVIFAGAVQDMVVLFFSTRRNGRSLGQMAREEIGPVGGVAALVAVMAIMIILLAVLAMVVVNALAESPWGSFSLIMTVPIALFMGVYLRFLRPGKVIETSAIGVVLLLLSIVGGGWVAEHAVLSELFLFSKNELTFGLIVYGFVASVLPVWLLLAPRDYLSTFMKVGVVVLLAASILIVAPDLRLPRFTDFAFNGEGPVFAGSLFPFVFITIACGALSGFHALISSGTTPKLIEKESQVRMIGYGSMLTESFVAIMALITACIIDPGVYFAMNMPATALGDTVQSAAAAVSQLGFTVDAQTLERTAELIGEESILARTGGAPTFALGAAQIFSAVFGGQAMMAFWYHFAVMFEALFILTTVDAGTRVGRFMLQDTLGNVYKPMRDPSWRPGAWLCSALIVGAWGYFLWAGVNDPLGGINQLFPLFGIANQLLAAIALAVCTTLIIKSGRAKYAWVTLVPLAWDAAVTLTASYQKIFSSDPAIGFFAQRQQFSEALAAGETSVGAIQGVEDMQRVVLNTTVNGVLSALFAILVLIILVDSVRVWIRALRAPEGTLPTSEAPHETSRLWAPSGLVPTREEREHARRLAPAGEGDVTARREE
ncbi:MULTISPECIES: carbon starvation CstA family protein [Nocardiopsis]|uniref:Carbon starvation protein CstA n=1 Tax=Nocardiopsis dassonvillei (strain ATCC 23218 / DSM 43111 / CIP 107115 / JCM 7437 / KCTC 9190 / NBRC 14626 / NCTC 10488 / NRRL B-5397 / IMRU 509) TaxID=446468 RepID=D7B6A0_NOCDD|nr:MULTISPECIES: carbon starvation CstA family protein [Nocardiopsis]ADH67365.1 carbon starvation protein CstA [Nocardiopsis dassonvillei subsp. dassonvillei DSM 43111]APC35576.1 carbon starvation protein A [Nocardiopsis dassonvillei]NKY77368.1 carbon starvation protein A [Nocardiopsis dassonvillei]VEI87503.1 Carbon starvation protein A [Nocardiopsis dassonvillei]